MSAAGEPTLGSRARSGARWAASAYYANTFVRLGVSVGLARLLAPADFGVMALAMAFVGFVALVQDSGLSSALVQHPEPVGPAASTVIVLTVAGGAALAALTWLSAPAIAVLLENPAVTPLLRVLGFLFVVRGFSHPGRALLQRAMGFRTLAGIELANTAAYGATAVALAATVGGVWALVVGQVVSEVVTLLLVWRAVPVRPRPADFDLGVARQLGGFGRHMVAASLLGMLHLQLPTLLVGKMLGAGILGLYWVAFRWAQLPIQGLTYVASRVAYPVYARLRNETGRFAEGYLRVLKAIVVLAMPASIGLALVAEPLMATLYDDRWQAGVAPLRILAFYGLFAAVGSTTGEVFKGAGLPRYVTIYAVLYNVLLGGALLLLGHGFGLEGIACATVVAPLGVSIVALRRVTIVLGIPARTIVGLLATPIQGTIVMVAVVLGMTQLLSSVAPPPAIRLAVLAVSGVVSYGAVLYLTDRAWCREAAATVGVTRGGVGRLERDVA